MQQLVDRIPYPAYVVLADPELTIKAWNRLIAAALRYALEEVIDRAAIERLRPVLGSRARAARERGMRKRDWWIGRTVLLDCDDRPVVFPRGMCCPVFPNSVKHYLTVLYPPEMGLLDPVPVSGPGERNSLRIISPANSDHDSTAPVEIHQSGVCGGHRDGAKVPLDDLLERTLTMIAKTDPDRAIDLRDQLTKDARREPHQRMRERFAERLRELLEYLNLSNREVATRMTLGDRGHDTISRYKHADRPPNGRMPQDADLVNLAKALGVSTAYFLDDDPPELTALRRGKL